MYPNLSSGWASGWPDKVQGPWRQPEPRNLNTCSVRHITHLLLKVFVTTPVHGLRFVKDCGWQQPYVTMFADADHFPEADVKAPGGTGPEIPALLDGHEADLLRSASNRLQLINPAHWPTNTFGILAQYDDAAECFRLTPPHEWDADEIPYSVIKGKRQRKQDGWSSGKGERPRTATRPPAQRRA